MAKKRDDSGRELERKRDARNAAEAKAAEQLAKETQPRRDTLNALRSLCALEQTSPATDVLGNAYLISAAEYAARVVALARYWHIEPGKDAETEHPIPKNPRVTRDLGIDAGRDIFNQALGGATATEIERLLASAWKQLGPTSADRFHEHYDTEMGVHAYIEALARWYDWEYGWCPPSRQQAQVSAPDRVDALGHSKKGGKRGAGPKRRGRRPEYDPEDDAELVKRWKASEMTRANFETGQGLAKGEVRRASDRIRAALNKERNK